MRRLRTDPRYADLVRHTYIEAEPSVNADLYEASGEWKAVRSLLGPALQVAQAIDLGAGNGIASRALARAGVAHVLAVEPDPSATIGRGAVAIACAGLPVTPIEGYGEAIPFGDGRADLVFARQVLHHTRDLEQTLRECHRVLRRGGVLLACREHVADTPEELAVFLAGHPVHRLTGGENAFPLARYRAAILDSGLRMTRVLGPWDSVINLHPAVEADEEIAELPRRLLRERLGPFGFLADVPLVARLAERRLRRDRPGRLFSFLAFKP